ncbi:Panacea domain-containing protein [Bacillus cereus]|uniref:Panacea domain-containing protein n=1 Tax=Bacillus cereus TaxID=1396 RepID=UPI0020D203F0|nr:type II toxin-antitoxin system antitoxin SocA domain-containing protein [Bacillus cereus]
MEERRNLSEMVDIRISAEDVAKYFLSQSTPNTRYSITHLKLQKLVYYAQGWHMALNHGQALFDEEIRAWVHGPVCPDLYDLYRHNQYFEIPPVDAPETVMNNENVKSTLDLVWHLYGAFDGKFLEELTHQEKPWLTARKGYRSNENGNNLITHCMMRDYFEKMLNGQVG